LQRVSKARHDRTGWWLAGFTFGQMRQECYTSRRGRQEQTLLFACHEIKGLAVAERANFQDPQLGRPALLRSKALPILKTPDGPEK
jgi:hypothetical protein